jgi:hypothetical protein
MPDADAETRACPFCKEEVKTAAIRCKHCLSDIPPTTPDHGGVCPFCKEAINAEALRCMHCRANLVPTVPVVTARARRPLRITTRQVPDRVRLGRGDLPDPPAARADRAGGGCPDYISTPYGTYHLVDSGVSADGWNYCGYEPGYGIFDDDDWVQYPATVLRG